MNQEKIIEALIIAARLVESLAAIAKNDPAAWERVKDDYNKAVDALKSVK